MFARTIALVLTVSLARTISLERIIAQLAFERCL